MDLLLSKERDTLYKDYLSLYYTDDNYTLNFKKTD